MQLEEIEVFFRHIADYYRSRPTKMDFVWHGGEPLLQAAGFYERVFELQKRFLGAAQLHFQNSIQTNLTVLDSHKIEFLRTHFDNIGVSVDLFGGLRVNSRGQPVQQIVLENMQRLLDSEVRFGCITVLSGRTASYIEEIFDFFIELGISFRLLPIYRTGFKSQHQQFGITRLQIVEAFKKATDRWFKMDGFLQVRPIQDYVTNVLRKFAVPPLPVELYDKRANETLFIVDTDGGVYSNADAYSREFLYGNIFSTTLETILSSVGSNRSIASSETRVAMTCSKCKFHGSCSGFFMAEATPEQRYLDEEGQLKCGIALPLHEYVEHKLTGLGILDLSTASIDRSKLPSFESFKPINAAMEF